MPWIKNQSGRAHFVSDAHYQKMINNKDKIEIIPDPTIKDQREIDPQTDEAGANLAKLRASFKEKFGQEVPVNKKNDASWIQERIEK